METGDNTPEIILTNATFLNKRRMEEHVDKMASDMKFFSIFYIIYGVLLSLSIIGAVIGIPMIIYHMKLNQSARSYRNFIQSKDFFYLYKAFEDQRKFFFFQKILLIIMLVFFILYIAAIVLLFSWGMSSFPQNFA